MDNETGENEDGEVTSGIRDKSRCNWSGWGFYRYAQWN